MKYSLTFLVMLFISQLFAQRVFVADFDMLDDRDDIGVAVANDFEFVLASCKRGFELAPRSAYRNKVRNADSFEAMRSKLKLNNIDYVLHGNVSYEATSGKYVIEYVFEELGTGAMIEVDNIYFDRYARLNDGKYRYMMIKARMIETNGICKKFDKEKEIDLPEDKAPLAEDIRKGKSMMLDTDGDGVPNLVDKEPQTPKDMDVDSRGVGIKPEDKSENIKPAFISKKTLDQETYPSLPVIAFESNDTIISDYAYIQLHQIGTLLKRYPLMKLEIIGTDVLDAGIASLRANAVQKYFNDHYKISHKRFILKHKITSDSNVSFIISKEEMDWSSFDN